MPTPQSCPSPSPVTAAVPALLLAALGLASTPDEESEMVSWGLGYEPLELSRGPELDDAVLEEIRRVAAAADPGQVLRFEGRVAEGEVEMSVRLAGAPLSLGGEPAYALLALTDAGNFLRAALVDEMGTPLDEWRNALDLFRFNDLPRVAGARPRAHLAAVRADVSQRTDDEEARLTLALLDTLVHMNEQASPYNLPEEGRRRTPAEDARMIAGQYRALADLAPDLAPLLRERAPEFVELALGSAEAARALAKAREAGDEAAAVQAQRRIDANCGQCHRMDLPWLDARVKEAFSDARHERGIGDGFYQVGHDVRISWHDREVLQGVADALRLAALALDAGRSR